MALQRRASGELLMTASGALADECCCGPIPPPAECDWSVSPPSLTFDCVAQNGAFNVNVLTGSGCGWDASVTSGGAYLTINSGASGSSSGAVGFSLLSNTGVDRTAQITVVTTVVSPLGPIGSLIGVFDLTQSECAGAPIVPGAPPPPGDVFRWSISPGSATFDCPSQNGFFNVNTQLGGGWAASVISGGSFITIFSGSSGSDAGTVQFSIALNSGPERAGQIEVITTIVSDLGPAGSVIGYFSIAQMAASACGSGGSGFAPCNWEVTNTPHTIVDPCAIESRFSDVNTSAGCSWNASVTTGAAFISITSGSSGLSSGTIAFDVDANTTGSRRHGVITVATGAGSAFGPPGTVIQEIQIDQDTCADCAGVPPLANSYTVSGGPVTQDNFCNAIPLGVFSPWDGVLPYYVPGAPLCDWQQGGIGSWLGYEVGGGGVANVSFQGPPTGWRLVIGDATYGKTTGASPEGIYTAVSCALPVNLTISL